MTTQYVYNPAIQQTETGSPPPDRLVTGHFRVGPPHAVYQPRGSGNWLITYSLDGPGIYRQPSVELHAGAGDSVLLYPHAVHDYRPAPARTRTISTTQRSP